MVDVAMTIFPTGQWVTLRRTEIVEKHQPALKRITELEAHVTADGVSLYEVVSWKPLL
jgi:hypothetical protein